MKLCTLEEKLIKDRLHGIEEILTDLVSDAYFL